MAADCDIPIKEEKPFFESELEDFDTVLNAGEFCEISMSGENDEEQVSTHYIGSESFYLHFIKSNVIQ